MSGLQHLEGELARLEARGQRRSRPTAGGRGEALELCSNDYLAYAGRRAAGPIAPAAPPGAGASRLVSGNHAAHEALEAAAARLVGLDDALVFSSGYAANLGLLSALAAPGDVVVSDALNHASIIDGCRLSRAEVAVVAHRDAGAVDAALGRARGQPGARRLWVVTEAYFSMDGDVPDLRRLRAVADLYGAALLVDEAHSLGVFGPQGRGLCAAEGVRPDALTGTFGKAFGGQGAFVAGSRLLTDWLWNRARSFVFSTGLSPALAEGNLRALERSMGDEPARARLASLSGRLRAALVGLGYRVAPESRGPIVPVLVGSEQAALSLARRLAAAGVRVIAIRPPTVPEGRSRLRVTVHAGLTDQELERAVSAFAEARGGA